MRWHIKQISKWLSTQLTGYDTIIKYYYTICIGFMEFETRNLKRAFIDWFPGYHIYFVYCILNTQAIRISFDIFGIHNHCVQANRFKIPFWS